MAVPTIYYKLITHWHQLPGLVQKEISTSLKNFRLMVSGSAALPITVLEEWKQISGHILLERYGMTEMGMAISNPYQGERRPGYIGQPLPGVQVRLADEKSNPVAEGIPGEIQIKGPNVFIEYWNKPKETVESFTSDGWFKTGDISLYENGSYKFLGRNSIDIIKSGGYKISALEIEEVLRSHPNIKDWLRDKLPGYKSPGKYIIQDQLPRNVMGKVTKNELKKYFQVSTMKHFISLFLAALFLFWGCTNLNSKKSDKRVKIIFDTDLGPDYDDVGALAFLHAMADSGKAEILATVSSNKHELVAPCIEVINTYFGRAGLAIGAPKTEGVNLGSPQHWADSIVAKYPHTIKSTYEVADAVDVYRKTLINQPDKSVTIVTVGFLTNLNNLLKSQPDNISLLTGKELVIRKVKRLVSMAGRFPEGREYNVYMDSAASEYVYKNWPGEIIFTGFEIGWDIRTGLKLIKSDIKNSPVKDVFSISIPLSAEDKDGRMSWDETAVLIGVYGTEGFFDSVRGKIIVNPDGSNRWENNPEGKHIYVKQKMPVTQMSTFIEDRMMHVPI